MAGATDGGMQISRGRGEYRCVHFDQTSRIIINIMN
jgi:hypothetical protein